MSEYDAAKQLMINRHLRGRGIRDPRVLAAMARVPREAFLPYELRDEAYADRALPIDCDQTISQPYIVALMSEALELTGAERVLEIGTGSGYQTAILAELAATVVTIERHAPLSAQAAQRLAKLGYRNIELKTGDGTLGWPAGAPYDRIIVTAAATKEPPPLVEQLAEDGILVIPVGGPAHQVLQAAHKRQGVLDIVSLSPCRFVPLIGAQSQMA
jgi:protein-L-isoaspartate(D-aspartate) O-methyltransferase